jgi:hypothetical protein
MRDPGSDPASSIVNQQSAQSAISTISNQDNQQSRQSAINTQQSAIICPASLPTPR